MPTLQFEQSGPEELHYKAKGFTFIVIGDEIDISFSRLSVHPKISRG